MVVCDFDECDFIECKLEEVSSDQFWGDFEYYDARENINREKGVIIYYLNITDVNDPVTEYLYSPVEYHTSQDKLQQWVASTAESLCKRPETVYLGQIFWYLKAYNCQLVKRDPKWITTHYPVLVRFWEEVQHYRKVGHDKIPPPYDDIIEEEIQPPTPTSASASASAPASAQRQISEYFKSSASETGTGVGAKPRISFKTTSPKSQKSQSRCLL
jgi:hypothetical protein